MHHGNDGNVVIATESGSYDGISISTISHTSPTMATDQQLAALSQFTSNIQSHHDHDQTTLYVLQDPSAGHHDGDHQHVRLHLNRIIIHCSCIFCVVIRQLHADIEITW